MTSISKRRRVSALLLAFGLGASACGTSTDDASSDTTAVTSVDAAGADPSTNDGEGLSAGEAPAGETAAGEAPVDEPTGSEDSTEAALPAAGETKRSRLGDQLLVANQSIESGRFEGRISIADPELPEGLELVFTGEYDTATQSSEISLDIGAIAMAASEAGGTDLGPFASMFDEPMVVRTVGNRSFVSWSLLSLLSGGQGTWIEGEAGDSDQITQAFGAGPAGSPTEFLSALEDANADITEVGTEDVRGVSTTHIRALVDLAELDAAVGEEERETLERDLGELAGSEFPIDFWIDDDGLIRRYSMDLDQSNSGGEGPTGATVVFEFFDYGADISIEVPPADEIVSADELDLESFGF